MNWRDYEEQVYRLLKAHLPYARLRKNVKIRGRYSARKRQIDILISEPTSQGRVRTIVDAKHFSRTVDVKAVDSLAGFVDDVGADAGMLVTGKGYSKAALRRASYGPADLELDVLNFDQLKRFQGFMAVPYAGDLGLLIRAPLGWIIDAKSEKGCLATLYQRGLDEPQARSKKEFIYINCWDKRLDPLSVSDLDALQVEALRGTGPVTVDYVKPMRDSDDFSRLRVADVDAFGCLEVAGFVEWEEAIFFAVLLTPRETQKQNMRRLEAVLRHALPVQLEKDNSPLIEVMQSQLPGASPSKRATLLCEIGHWYRDMGDFKAAREVLEECLSLEPRAYYAVKELIPVLKKLGDKEAVQLWLGRLLRLDPHNPTVYNDALDFVHRGPVTPTELVALMDEVAREREGDDLTQASVDFYAAQLLLLEDPVLAKRRLADAEKRFRGAVARGHQVFTALRQLKRALLDSSG